MRNRFLIFTAIAVFVAVAYLPIAKAATSPNAWALAYNKLAKSKGWKEAVELPLHCHSVRDKIDKSVDLECTNVLVDMDGSLSCFTVVLPVPPMEGSLPRQPKALWKTKCPKSLAA